MTRKLTFEHQSNTKSSSSRPAVFCKKVVFRISQNSQENTHARDSFLIKLLVLSLQLYKKSLWHRSFRVILAKFLRTPFFTEHLRWPLLKEETECDNLSIKKKFTAPQINTAIHGLSYLGAVKTLAKKLCISEGKEHQFFGEYVYLLNE